MAIDSGKFLELNLDDCVCEFTVLLNSYAREIPSISFDGPNIFYSESRDVVTIKDVDYFEESSR